LRSARTEIEKWNTQRAESQARLDELKSRLETLESRLNAAQKAIESTEVHGRQAEEKHMADRRGRGEAETWLRDAESKLGEKRRSLERLETGRRATAEERAQKLAEHTRLKAQLEVLEQAEQSLAGYAEGARFLLDAARQARLKGARGALSTSLDVPAELEVAVAAALGDTLDAILLDANEIDDALQLLESDGAGPRARRAADGCPFAAWSNTDCPGSRDRAAFVGRFADPRAHRHAAR
jgi:chromosome segregation protein